MAKDIRDLFEADKKMSVEKMPEGHEHRFLKKLEAVKPERKKSRFSFINIAASIVLLLGLSFGAFQIFNTDDPSGKEVTVTEPEENVKTMTLGEISPDLKKVEDYYLANINLELSKIKLTPENKELFDGYVNRLNDLKAEYHRLSVELANEGPDEPTVDALISNLKLRLKLMYRLKEQLKDLSAANSGRI
ncbi:hypothetical protein [uncultured Lacinutrix sp.]|uniref:hypothetical protein n=1 Tax=uncultured Lacinutrix sp. TaxID=574032 RepID=UPI0026224A76|nr:hypothetical protein [uncultured Lacinutrix sp.]